MSGKALSRMREILNATGAYKLTGESSADWELNACGAGFSLVEDAIDGLLRDLFAFTASGVRLDCWEKLFRPQPSSGTLEQRQSLVGERLAMNPGRMTREEFSTMLRGAGVEGAVLEENGGLRILLGRLLGIPEEEAKRELDAVLPAHLPWTWDSSVTWTALDAWLPDFQTLDAAGLTWADWDGIGRETLEQLGQEGN